MTRPLLMLIDPATRTTVTLDVDGVYALAAGDPSRDVRALADLTLSRAVRNGQEPSAATTDGDSADGDPHARDVVGNVLLRRGEVADMLSVSVSTVDRLARRGEITKVRPSPGSVRYRRDEIEEYLHG